MSKAVLISIRPRWCQKIVNGEKTIEVRKTRPKLQTPFKCYIYCTSGGPDLNIPISPERLMQDYLETGSMKSLNCPSGNGKVIGEFMCRGFIPFCKGRPCFVIETPEEIERMACLTRREIWQYAPEGNPIGWRISDLVIYDIPRELVEFTGLRETRFGAEPVTIKRPPQSWCYVEEVE